MNETVSAFTRLKQKLELNVFECWRRDMQDCAALLLQKFMKRQKAYGVKTLSCVERS